MSADDAWYGKTEQGHLYKFRWDTRHGNIRRNAGGITGWARVLRSSEGDVRDDACRRVHKCGHDPCRAKWPPVKYGLFPPPIHVQEVDSAEAIFGPEVPSSVPLQDIVAAEPICEPEVPSSVHRDVAAELANIDRQFDLRM